MHRKNKRQNCLHNGNEKKQIDRPQSLNLEGWRSLNPSLCSSQSSIPQTEDNVSLKLRKKKKSGFVKNTWHNFKRAFMKNSKDNLLIEEEEENEINNHDSKHTKDSSVDNHIYRGPLETMSVFEQSGTNRGRNFYCSVCKQDVTSSSAEETVQDHENTSIHKWYLRLRRNGYVPAEGSSGYGARGGRKLKKDGAFFFSCDQCQRLHKTRDELKSHKCQPSTSLQAPPLATFDEDIHSTKRMKADIDLLKVGLDIINKSNIVILFPCCLFINYWFHFLW